MRTAEAASQDHLSQEQAASPTSNKPQSYQFSLISAELIGLGQEQRPIHSEIKIKYKVNKFMTSSKLFADQ
jgi:hypothetical protein